MTRPSLDGVWRKFDRGVTHFEAFEKEFDRVVGPDKTQDIPFDRSLEGQTRLTKTYLWRGGELPDLEGSDCPVILGDCLVNYRAALDHLAWIIVKQRGTPLSKLKPGTREKIQFPLARSRTKFPAALRRNLPGVSPSSSLGHLVAVNQPYRGSNAGASMRALRDLTNRDKHRLLVMTGWIIKELGLDIDAPGHSIISKEILIPPEARVFKTGTPVVRATLSEISVNAPEPKLKGKGSLYPGLSGGWLAFATLKEIRTTVRTIIETTALLL